MALADWARDGRLGLRFSGSGGQGILLAATVLAEAATALGYHVVQTQSYGPEARGGASRSEVVIAEEEIDYPEVPHPDISLCLSQAAYDKYAADTRPGGLLVVDSDLVASDERVAHCVLRALPFTATARGRLGKVVVTNIVALGALTALSGVLPPAAVEEAVLRRVPERFRDLNREAFRAGAELAAAAGAAAGAR